jgi:hypothetical protein
LRSSSHHQPAVVAGPWSFPAPSSALPVTRRTLEGSDCTPSSSNHHLAATELRIQAPDLFAPLQSFADSPRSDDRPSSPGIRPDRRTHRTSLPDGVSSDLHTPPSTCSPASTPSAMSPPRLRPLVNQTRSPVPTSWFLTTSPVCSAARSVRSAHPFRCKESRACCIPLPIVGFIAFRSRSSCFQAARLFPATLPTPRRIPPIHSRTVSPRPLAFLAFLRRAARTSRVRVAASAFQHASRRELTFKALLCG